jgi:hypothetical protein
MEKEFYRANSSYYFSCPVPAIFPVLPQPYGSILKKDQNLNWYFLPLIPAKVLNPFNNSGREMFCHPGKRVSLIHFTPSVEYKFSPEEVLFWIFGLVKYVCKTLY